MTFWLQHGYGKSNKIDTTDDMAELSGVILSPGDEERPALVNTARSLNQRNLEVLVDPQLYVHTIPEATARCHESNEVDFGRLSWFLSPAEISSQVEKVFELNSALRTDALISPGPYQVTFGDVWSPLSLQYGRASVDGANGPVYLSVVSEDSAFSNWDETQRYLDALTTIDAQGIYLIVGHSGRTYPLVWDPSRLAHVLRAIYTLAELNRYRVLWGYSDLAGLAGIAAGASGSATGWFYSLRMWSVQKWLPQSGGRQPNARFLVKSLMSPLERSAEAVSVARTSIGADVFPEESERASLIAEEPWSIADSWIQHLTAVSQLHAEYDNEAPVGVRIRALASQLGEAQRLLKHSGSEGASIAPTYGRALRSLQLGLEMFGELEGL